MTHLLWHALAKASPLSGESGPAPRLLPTNGACRGEAEPRGAAHPPLRSWARNLEHGVHPEGLREVGIESRVAGTVSDFLLRMTRGRDQEHVLQTRLLPQVPSYFIAAQAR